MKSEKYTEATAKQRRILANLAVAVQGRISQHEATRLINKAIARLKLGRSVRLKDYKAVGA